jgi:tetratricopeptide (TPR) repeat protein
VNRSDQEKGARYNWLLPIGFLVLLLPGIRTISHSSFWTHLASGRNGFARLDSLTQAGADTPWINGHWLYDICIALVWRMGGAPLVTLVHVLAIAAAFILLARVIRPHVAPGVIALTLCLSGWLLAPRFEAGPELFSLLFAAIFVRVLSGATMRPAAFAVLVPLQILWTNMDASFLWGPVIAALFAIQFFLAPPVGQRTLNNIRLPVLLVVALLLSTLLNPYGPALYPPSIQAWTMLPASGWISPLSGLFPSTLARNLITLSLMLGAAGLLLRRERLPFALTALAMCAALLAVVNMPGFVIWLALFGLPFLCLSLQTLYDLVDRQSASLRIGSRVTALAVLLVLLITVLAIPSNKYYTATGSFSAFGLGVARHVQPVGAAEVVNLPEFPASFISLPMDGGYFSYALNGRKPFVDLRSRVLNPDTYRLIAQALMGDEQAWQRLDLESAPQAIILNNTWPLASDAWRALMSSGTWVPLYFDGLSTILVRNQDENTPLLDQRDVFQAAGLTRLEEYRQTYAADLTRLQRPALPAPLIGAATIYRMRQMPAEAAACYSLIDKGAPRMLGTLLHLGISQLQLRQPDRAVATLDRALARLPMDDPQRVMAELNAGLGRLALEEFAQAQAHLARVLDKVPDDAQIWLHMSRAYQGLSQPGDARMAVERARAINPQLTAEFLRRFEQ